MELTIHYLAGKKSSIIGKNVWKLLVSGMAVSLLSAMLVGLFVW